MKENLSNAEKQRIYIDGIKKIVPLLKINCAYFSMDELERYSNIAMNAKKYTKITTPINDDPELTKEYRNFFMLVHNFYVETFQQVVEEEKTVGQK